MTLQQSVHFIAYCDGIVAATCHDHACPNVVGAGTPEQLTAVLSQARWTTDGDHHYCPTHKP